LHVGFHGSLCQSFYAGEYFFTYLLFAALTRHRPIKAQWFEATAEYCIDESIVTYGGGYTKLFVDVLIATLPIPLVIRLKTALKDRVEVSMLLGLGYVVAICGAVRQYYTWKAIESHTYDVVWYKYSTFVAGTVENDLGTVRLFRFPTF
jgi:hypothetical protein